MPKFIATTLQNLEPYLAEELTALGATEVEVLKRACSFMGDKKTLYRVNYEARTAIRVLYPVLEFEAKNEQELYNGVRHLDWDKFMDLRDTFAIRAVVRSERFKHSHYAALKVKDAIADQFRAKYNKRPNINTENPDIHIALYIRGTEVSILLDSSGDSLHLRGYRREQLDAPLNEVLAAGMLKMAGYDGSMPFLDPMCGSGTLPVEAAMIATNTPAQKFRRRFAFFRWKNFDKKLFETVKAEAEARIVEAKQPIFAKDLAKRGRNATMINAMGAEMDKLIQIDNADFFETEAPAPNGLIVCNPPYDERMELQDATEFYKKMGDALKQNYAGWKAWVISSHTDAFKHFGLKPFKKEHLLNGKLECWFRGFEMREGKF